MYAEMDKRVAATIRGLKEKHNLELNENEVLEMLEQIRSNLSFGTTTLESEIVRMLMALHTIDEDEYCTGFYFDVQERLDELRMSEGLEPIKDKLYANSVNNLINSGHLEEVKRFNFKENKIEKGQRINFDYKVRMQNVTQEKIQEWIAKKNPQ